ncbi:MAG: MFS transporter [Dehalococcoidia bacterium]|nr:MFS transporter [Dehalococcoidia bacterium]
MLRRLAPNVYEGWIVVGSAAVMVLIFAATFFYGFGTIFNEVIDEFGWSVAATSLAFSLRSEVGGLAAPVVGGMVDRMGAQRVILAGIVVSTLGVLAMSYIQEIWHFYAAMVIIAFGSSSAGGQVGLAAIATWFEERRARAMSLMTVGAGLGGLLVVVIAWLVEQVGWRDALRILALFMATFGTLVAVNVRSRPLDHPQPMDGRRYLDALGAEMPTAVRWGIQWRRALRTRAFVLMALGMVALSFGTTAVVVHQIPYLEREIGASKALAGSSVAVFTLTSIVGRLGFGFLADRYEKRRMMAVATGLVVLGLPILTFADSFAMAMLGIVLLAPGFGGSIPVRPALLADYFGTRYFGTMNGIGALVMTTGGAIGPWVVGFMVDRTGSYDGGWLLATGVTALAIPLFLLARPPDALIEAARAEATAERATGDADCAEAAAERATASE